MFYFIDRFLYSDFNQRILKSAFFAHGNTKRSVVIAYRPIEYISIKCLYESDIPQLKRLL